MVKTASGARAVQIVQSNRGARARSRHPESEHDEAELALKAAARQRLAVGRGELRPRAGGGGVGPGADRGASFGVIGGRVVAGWGACQRVHRGPTGWTIKQFVRTARRYPIVQIRVTCSLPFLTALRATGRPTSLACPAFRLTCDWLQPWPSLYLQRAMHQAPACRR